MRRTLTAKTIAALKPRADRYIVRDPKVSGLELRVAPDGTKSWSLRYRIHGQQRRLKLGEYRRISLATAREHANRELRKIDAGIDPQAERQETKRAIERAKRDSVDGLCDRYLERHAKRKKRTWRADQGHIKNAILPRWKGRAVSTITRPDCRALVQAIAERGAPIVANRVAALLSRLFRYAVDEEEIITVNPAAHLPKPGVEAASRPDGEREQKPYAPDEIRTIWRNTASLDPAPRAIIRLGLLTGQRPTEISDLEWRELEGSWWTLPGARTKNGREHRVYLTHTALDVLKDVPRLADEPRAFAGYRGKRQGSGINRTAFAGLRRRKRPRHALRDTVATGLAGAGIAVEDIAQVLNHTYGPRVTAGYNAYSYDKEKRVAMGKWERRLTAMLESATTQNDAKVVAIAR